MVPVKLTPFHQQPSHRRRSPGRISGRLRCADGPSNCQTCCPRRISTTTRRLYNRPPWPRRNRIKHAAEASLPLPCHRRSSDRKCKAPVLTDAHRGFLPASPLCRSNRNQTSECIVNLADPVQAILMLQHRSKFARISARKLAIFCDRVRFRFRLRQANRSRS